MSAVDKAKNDAPSASAPPVLKSTRPATPPPPPARAGATSAPKPFPNFRPNGLGLAPVGPSTTPPRLDAPPPSPPPTLYRDSLCPSSARTRASPSPRRPRHDSTRARRTTPSAPKIRTRPRHHPASRHLERNSSSPSRQATTTAGRARPYAPYGHIDSNQGYGRRISRRV